MFTKSQLEEWRGYWDLSTSGNCWHGNKAFSGGTGFSTVLLLGLIDIGAASHKDMVDLLGVEREVLGTSKAEIGDGRARIRLHALSKALQGWPIEGFVVGLANEVVGGDH